MKILKPSNYQYLKIANCLRELVDILFPTTDTVANHTLEIIELTQTVSGLVDMHETKVNPFEYVESYDIEVVPGKNRWKEGYPGAFSFCFNGNDIKAAEELREQHIQQGVQKWGVVNRDEIHVCEICGGTEGVTVVFYEIKDTKAGSHYYHANCLAKLVGLKSVK